MKSEAWKEIGGEKKISINDFGDLKDKIIKIREMLVAQREQLVVKLAAANEAVARAKNGGGK